ncbi:MAG: HIT domain-containing protein [Bacteroidia bacterium]|nr:HIT domain-containing protein [Bacteroidia bacterium]
MIYRSPDNPHSHLTAIDRKELSFPSRKLWELGLLQGRVLDFGCGKMKDLEVLQSQGLDISGYDPHYLPQWPEGKFDTIICHYVLNVLMPVEQTHVLMSISELLRPGGTAYFTVRRDLDKEGFRMHKAHGVATYQCNVILPFHSHLKARHCEIYAYRHYPIAMPEQVARFCFGNPAELISETASAYAIYSQTPIKPGHALIIPKRAVSDYFDLTLREQTACTLLLNRAKEHLDTRFSPTSFNIIINTGPAAGQEIPQVHLHLIPRKEEIRPER